MMTKKEVAWVWKALVLTVALFMLALFALGEAHAKGGFSSSGGGRSYSSSSARSYSAPRSSYSAPRQSYSPRTTTRTTTTTTVTRRGYSSRYVSNYGGNCCGVMGGGFAYSNGLMTGMILGSMMHPMGTVLYTGMGPYSGTALLYPNGQVVSASGVLVGTYVGGVYTPVANGPVVAQPVPAEAMAPPAQPVIIQHDDEAAVYAMIVVMGLVLLVLIVALIA